MTSRAGTSPSVCYRLGVPPHPLPSPTRLGMCFRLWRAVSSPCFHIHLLGQPVYGAPGAAGMSHKTSMSLPRGAGGLAEGLLFVCVLFDFNVFICLMPPTSLQGRGDRLGEGRGTLTNL